MSTPTVQNMARQWRRWRTWVGLLLLGVLFLGIQSHPPVWSQSDAPLLWVSSDPTPDQRDVYVDGVIRLQFSQPLDPNLRRLVADLAPPLQKRARMSDSPLRNILSSAGSERANAKKAGLAAAQMISAQRDLLWQLVETYAV
ncbi:MAG: hypothetical protein Q6M04_06600, partial [Thermostichus sp. BF3_bins_97]